LEKLGQLLDQLKVAQFNGKLIRFRANESTSEWTIGKIEFDELNGPKEMEMEIDSLGKARGVEVSMIIDNIKYL
jgi:hypothetical protein